MLQRLPTALAQVKVGNTSESLISKVRQIMYYLYRAKQINKKLYKNCDRNQLSYKTEWMLYLWSLELVKNLILTNLYSIFQIK